MRRNLRKVATEEKAFDASTSESLPIHQYQDLKGNNVIRLLSLKPGKESHQNRLECELEDISLSDDPPFEALSYAWGDCDFSEIIFCGNAAINITRNLHDALIRFRHPDHSRKLWVDAVCINQSNGQEKSLQVPLMAKIYGQATEVLIWLGAETEGSNDVMEYLKRIGQAFISRGGEVNEPRDERSTSNDALWASVAQDPNLEKTHLVLARPWFSRRWVIQETALARKATLHCGTVNMEWDVLFFAVTALARLRGDGSYFWNKATGRPVQMRPCYMQNVSKLNDVRNDIWMEKGDRKSSGRQLHDCMDDARAFECRDDKDRVFALLGILNRGRDIPFQVDYGKSAAEVYEAFARYCLRYGETVDILSWAGEANLSSMQDRADVPSWVPDWRLPFRSPTDTLSNFRAGHRLASMVEVDDSSKILLVKGMMVDRLHTISSSIDAFKAPGQVQRWYYHVEHFFTTLLGATVGGKEKYLTGEDAWEALARTLVCNREDVVFDYSRDKPEEAKYEPSDPTALLSDYFPLWRHRIFSSPHPPSLDPQPPDPSESEPLLIVESFENIEYQLRVTDFCTHRPFFITRKGYIGLGPKGTKAGDVVAVFAGSSTPYVLRPEREDFCLVGEGPVEIGRRGMAVMPNGEVKHYLLRKRQETYRLVGEAYVHGLMEGEVWDLEGVCFEDFAIA